MSVNSAPDLNLSLVPVVPGIAASPVEQVANIGPGQVQSVSISSQLVQSVGMAKQKLQVGLQSKDGSFIDYSKKLPQLNSDGSDNPDYLKLLELVGRYSFRYPTGPRMNFAINLSDLKDGDGQVLMPAQLPNGSIESAESFEENMKTLRQIAKKTLGVETLHWDSYPQGYRAVVGQTEAFNTGNSHRLKEHFDYDIQHLLKWLEEIDVEEYTPDPAIDEPAQVAKKQAWDVEKQARKTQAVKGFHAATALLHGSKSALKLQIKNLEADASSGNPQPGLGARLDKLRKLRDRLDQKAFSAATLYAASHLHHGEERPDLQKRHADAQAHLDSFPKPTADCSGFLTFMKTSEYAELLPDNQETEKDFLLSLELLSLNIAQDDRPKFESYRKALDAKGKSDGPELFFVQLAGAMATDPQKIGDSLTGSAFEIAFGGLDSEDQAFCSSFMYSVAERMSEAFKKGDTTSNGVLQNSAELVKHYATKI